MAREDVNIKVSANVAEAIQLWKAMEQGPNDMAKAIGGMGQKGKTSVKGMGDELVGMVGKWASAGAAVAAVTKLIESQGEALRKLREAQLDATDTVDDSFNRFQVQAGIPKGAQADAFRQQFMATAAQRKALPETAMTVGTQLIASGASTDEVLGMTDEILQLMSATNALEGPTAADPRQFAKAFVQMLKANNLKLTKENVHKQAVAAQGLYMGSNLELAELTQFAPAAATIRSFAHTTPEQSLAIATQFLQLTDIANSATAFRTGVTRLATGSANSEVKRGLSMIGLKPEQVDFQGEDFETVMRRLTDAFRKTGETKGNPAARLIFGRAGLPFYTILTQPGTMDEMHKLLGLTSNEAGFQQAVSTAESGRGAKRREGKALSEDALYKDGKLDPKVVKERFQQIEKQLGLSKWQRANAESYLDEALPWGISSIFGGYETTEFKTGMAARKAASFAKINEAFSNNPRLTPDSDEIYNKATGAAPVTIEHVVKVQIQTDQGHDLHHDPIAINLSAGGRGDFGGGSSVGGGSVSGSW